MNLLVTGSFAWTAEDLERLEKAGHQIAFLQYECDILPCDSAWVEGTICNGLFLTHPIECFSNLRYIQLTSAGFERVPMEYIKAHNIQLCNARGVYSIPMSEFAVSGVLDILKQKAFFFQNQTEHIWKKNRKLLELYRKTICIVGCGSVGTECAKRFKGFGCRIVGVDLKPSVSEYYDQIFSIDNLDEILPVCDVIVLSLPLTNDTYGLVSEERLADMKDGSILVNIARGAVVDQKALTEELKSGRLYAVLDVFNEEPLADDSVLWDLPNVIITPHNSFVSDQIHDRMFNVIFDNLAVK